MAKSKRVTTAAAKSAVTAVAQPPTVPPKAEPVASGWTIAERDDYLATTRLGDLAITRLSAEELMPLRITYVRPTHISYYTWRKLSRAMKRLLSGADKSIGLPNSFIVVHDPVRPKRIRKQVWDAMTTAMRVEFGVKG